MSEIAAHHGAVRRLFGEGGLVILAADPAEGTLVCGALLASCFSAGQKIHVVVVTDGAPLHGRSGSWPPARLSEVRRDEAIRAIRALGGTERDLTFLGLPVSASALRDTALIHAATAVSLAMIRSRADVLLVASGEPLAHEATWGIADAAVGQRPATRLFHCPLRSRPIDEAPQTGPVQRLHRLPLGPWARTKRSALAAHRSQMGSEGSEDMVLPRNLPEAWLAEDELFLEATELPVSE